LLGAGIATFGVIATAPARFPSRPGLALAALAIGLGVSFAPIHHPRRWVAATAVLLCGGIALASAVSSSRLTVSSPDRADEWRTTWAVARSHPTTGVGPSHLDLAWKAADGQTYVAHATHNEFLQLAAEQGLPALAVALATLAAIATVLVRRRQGVALAVLLAFVAASAFDFVWHVALIPIVVAALVGTALPLSDDGGYGRPAPTR
jgi:O-antigen ligase